MRRYKLQPVKVIQSPNLHMVVSYDLSKNHSVITLNSHKLRSKDITDLWLGFGATERKKLIQALLNHIDYEEDAEV